MIQEIKSICLPLPFRLGSVDCYLLRTDRGHVLIDTGPRAGRAALVKALTEAGCKAGNLSLILLTHGDFDHSGNAAHLKCTMRTPIAMHSADVGMVERGDMSWGRKKGNPLMRGMVPIILGFTKADRFTPDQCVEDGFDLSGYGLDARVLSIPGHSSGSIGILSARGDLFCGDLFTNGINPSLNDMTDAPPIARASVERLRGMQIKTIYPGHGKPFTSEEVFRTALG